MPQAAEAYLRTLKVPDAVKADAWDAIYSAKDDADAEARLKRLPVSNDVRAQLWDLRAPAVSTPAPAAATAGMLPQSTMADEPTPAVDVMTPEKWAALTPGERARNVLQWGGKVIAGMTGMGAAGREAVEHPVATLATATVPVSARALAPVARAVKPVVWPTRAAAGAKFQQVMGAARDVPVDTSAAERVASRIWELSGGLGKTGRGGSMPKPVSDFIKRMTDPNKGPMLYEESRDFASNLSRLSAKDWSSVNPVIGAEIHKMRVALHAANARAATQAGKGAEYLAAMKEYARAAQRAKLVKQYGTKAAKAAGVGAAGAAGAGAAYRVFFD